MTVHKLEVSPLNNSASCLCGRWSFTCRQETAALIQNFQRRQKSTDAVEAKVLREFRAVHKTYRFHLLQSRETVHEQ